MLLKLLLLGILISAHSCIPLQGNIETNEITPLIEDEDYRLNELTVPQHYNLEITPYFKDENEFKEFTFNGIVEIIVSTQTEGRNSIKLNMKNLDIKSRTLCKMNEPTVCITIDPDIYIVETEILQLYLATPLEISTLYTLRFEYIGSMDDDMHGFYRSSYMENGVRKWLGATQLEQTHARRVFPGYDEPQYKSNYKLTLIIPNELNAISNTAAVGEPEPVGTDRKKIVFEQTPYMSSYLLAFIVSEFVPHVNTEYPNFKVWSTPEQNDLAAYASQVGPLLLNKLNEYLDYSYDRMINKMDMAAIPDFSAGAMENWGLLTYRETNQLYDPNLTTDLTKQRIAAVITHEQAHMWFGDLVTCEWWGYIWLNEGFARYFQYHGTPWIEGDWNMEDQFPIEQVQSAMLVDQVDTTHAMTHKVVTPADASAAFDNIAYNKGSSVIRMFKHVMGETPFRDALREYLNEMAYKLATPEDIFRNLEKHSYEGFTQDMEGWTTQPGFPIIKVDVVDSTNVAITQKRFLLEPKSDNTLWTIPLTYVNKLGSFQSTTPTLTLKEKSSTFEIENTDSWLIFNVQQTGFYRVDYNDENWELISTALKSENHDDIHEINRAQIIDDLLNIGRAGERDYKFVLQHIEFLEHEHHYLPWLSAFTSFSFLQSRMDASAQAKFMLYIQKLISHVFEHLEFEKKSDDRTIDVYNRASVINWACRAGNENCITQAQELFSKYKDPANPVAINVNIRQAVLCTAIREGDEEDFDFLWQKYQEEEFAAEKVVILGALGCIRNETLLFTYLDHIFSDEVRLQDKRAAFSATYTNTLSNLDSVIDYVYNKHTKIEESFGSRGELMSSFTALAGRFTTEAQLTKFEEFFAENSVHFEANTATIQRAVVGVRTNFVWIGKNMNDIETYIDDYLNGSAVRNSVGFLTIFAALVINYIRN